MKKVLTVLTCGILAACSCNDTQWEEVDNVVYDEAVYVEPAPVEPAPIVVAQEPVYVPTPVYDQPCAEVACCQPMSCMQMQPCCHQMPAPQPKVTTTKKIITTTTTVEEPCGKEVCEPVVTVHEEIVPAEVTVEPTPVVANPAPVVVEPAPVPAPAPVEDALEQEDYVEVTVEKNPYRSDVVSMKASNKSEVKALADYSPEVYMVVASRAANRMLQDTSAIYDSGKTRTLYLKDTKLLSNDLPYGSHRLKGVTKDIISGSKTFDIVNNSKNADFIAETSADWYVAPNNTIPALQYTLTLLDKNGKKVNEWVEVIRQVQD
jgi:hypothetical protein